MVYGKIAMKRNGHHMRNLSGAYEYDGNINSDKRVRC